MTFVHLHCHSEFSLLDGLSKVKALVEQARRDHQPALALTDHGAMYGAVSFYRAAVAAGVKPILGVETYIAPRGMTDRTAEDRQYSHLVLLARDDTGYRNLLKLVTKSYLEGYYYKPRVDRDALSEHSEGILALSACPSGEIGRSILTGDMDAAREAASAYRDIFGQDGFFLELQSHGLIEPDEGKIVRGKLKLSKDLGIPVVATNDVHYARPDQNHAHDLLLAIQTNSRLDEIARMRMEKPHFYLKTHVEMLELFHEVPEAVRNTLVVADRCNLRLEFDRLEFPELGHVIPPGVSPIDHLTALCREALPSKYPDGRDAAEARLAYELDVIGKTDFATY